MKYFIILLKILKENNLICVIWALERFMWLCEGINGGIACHKVVKSAKIIMVHPKKQNCGANKLFKLDFPLLLDLWNRNIFCFIFWS